MSNLLGTAQMDPEPSRCLAMGVSDLITPRTLLLGQTLIVYRIVDDEGKDVEVGKEGELLLKGPIVFKGYHNNPEASKDAFDSEGYFRTGDVGMFQNGMFYIVDRKKELIKYKGAYFHIPTYLTRRLLALIGKAPRHQEHMSLLTNPRSRKSR